MATQLLQDFPELSHLSREDLEDMLTDPAYFQAIFHSLPRVKALYQSQAEFGMANESIANKNLELQQSLYNLRAGAKQAFDDAKALEARWKELDREQREVYQRFTPQFLLMRLRHATIAQDELSESLATAFISASPTPHVASNLTVSNLGTSGPASGTGTPGGLDVEEFVRDFKDQRKIYHKRVIWGDRWTAGQVDWPNE
ncbi:hypothetical protein HGRIS_004661 [Hohenbuehelia grisea]|uniref:VPS37 C-terminal domain-containing protein n=1 Tax=Hohenbuehelia grisea TaxID=104357 RepID=A0ABR3JE83_9AGAR